MVRSIRYSGAKKNGDMKSLSDGVLFQVACFRINVIALEGVGGAGGKEAREKRTRRTRNRPREYKKDLRFPHRISRWIVLFARTSKFD